MKKRYTHQKTIITVPTILYQDDNKLELEVQSKTQSDKTYIVTITRHPPHVSCNCKGYMNHKYCHHLQDVKGYTENFIKKRVQMDMTYSKKER